MTNMEMIKKLVKNMGAENIFEAIKAAEEEIRREEAKWTTLIHPYEYSSAGHVGSKKPEFPEWVTETFDSVVAECSGIRLREHGDGSSKDLAITNKNFAKYIVWSCNDDGKTLRDVIEVLTAAPDWCKGRGLTKQNMELVAHMLILHRNHTDAVKAELKRILNREDQISLKVHANDDDDFRHVLNYEIKKIAFVEKLLCGSVVEVAKFRYGKAAA